MVNSHLGPTSNNVPDSRRRFDQLRTRAEILSRYAPDSALIYLDSAQNIAASLPDSTSVIPEILLSRAIIFDEQAAPDSAIAILEDLHSVSIQRGDVYHTARSALLLGEIYLNKHQLALSKPFLFEALAHFENSSEREVLGRVLTGTGVYHMRSSEFETAQNHFLRALNIYDSLQYKAQVANVQLNLASNFMEVGEREEALRQLHNALHTAREVKDTAIILNILNDLGIAYRRSNQDSALSIYRSAFSMIKDGRFAEDYNRIRFNLANILLDQGDVQSALDTFRSVYRSSKELGFPIGIVVSCSGTSEILEKKGDLQAALTWAEEAIAAMRPEPGPSRMLIDLLDQKARLLRKIGKYEEALELKGKVVSMDRALTDGQKQLSLLEMEKAFQYERKVSENIEIKENLVFRSWQKIIMLILFGGLLTVSVILAFLLRQRKLMTMRLESAYHKLIRQYRNQKEVSHVVVAPPLRGEAVPSDSNTQRNSPSSPVQNLADRLEDWLNKERPFLDPKFRVDTACERLQTNAKALAQALRQNRGTNFNSLVNKARVQEAMRLMADPEYSHYKVEFIGYRAGFGTKQTFYTAFEQETGLTPGFYRSSVMDVESQSEEP